MNKILIGAFSFVILSTVLYYITGEGNSYVSATTGTLCYVKGHEPKTIKRKVYHADLYDCESYISNFQ